MGDWLVTLKPNRTSPYLNRCRDASDAESRKERAESDGLVAQVYHTATDDIHEAKRQLKRQISDDFGYMASNSNYGVGE